MPTIREVLNKIKWSQCKLDRTQITITHRGAPGNVKVIRGSSVKDVAPRALLIEEGGEEVIIPYHRIKAIQIGEETIWKKRGRPGMKNE